MRKLINQLFALIFILLLSLNTLTLSADAYSQSDLEQLLKTNVCTECDLTDAILTDAILKKADLASANLTEAVLGNVMLGKTNLKNANWMLSMTNLDSLPIAEKVAFRRNSVRVMRDLLALSTIMIQGEEYQRGKDIFFVPSRKIWFMFGGTIKRLSPDLGKSIEALFNSINTMLEQTSPSKTTLVTSLTELNRSMDQAVQISDEKL